MLSNKKYELIPSRTFLKELDKLSDAHKNKVLDTLEILKTTPFYPSLRTKKIKNNYESSVNMDIRIIWRFKESKIIALLDVGHHDILKEY
jgi:mRNA-degrading endonuclease RelE of RelBE toxin-antitoxin system